MTAEQISTLNTDVLVGMTDERGHAWHYKAELQGDEPNHYPGAIPVEDVRRRLFNWHAISGPMETTYLTDEGVVRVSDDQRQVIVRPDLNTIIGAHGPDHRIHQYDEWLIDNVAVVLDDGLVIGSAGLLKGGSMAWVSIEVPDTFTTPAGVAFRGHLLATTSMDGSLASHYKEVVTNVICDNTHAAAMGERGPQMRYKHTEGSRFRALEVREALGLIHTLETRFADQIERWTNTTVSDSQWAQFVEAHTPTVDEDGRKKEGRSRTIALNKQDTLHQLYFHDMRVAPWAGTAWGVVQAVNTATHHVFGSKASRVERNMLGAVTGKFERLDRKTMDTLDRVLVGA